MAPHIKLNHRITSIAKDGHDRMKNGQRDEAPFLIVANTPHAPRRFKAEAVIDVSGTWTTPSPLGAGGVYADGETEYAEHIRYGMPDERERYEGKRVLVVGSGHSAIGTVLNLIDLAERNRDTQVAWAIRGTDPRKLWGGGENDQLEACGALGTKVFKAVESGAVTLLTSMTLLETTESGGRWRNSAVPTGFYDDWPSRVASVYR